jgi:hypothetical protein
MAYLSKQIEAFAKKKQQHSLIKKENSCGIFQDYGLGVQVNQLKKNPKL